ncbi:MAG: hypothetical protein EOL97_08010 [Spirochaetia bacterium]|nr:hypothetical protein [Spirochaetia bacterium]
MKNNIQDLFNFEIAQELSKTYNTIESKYVLINNLKKYYNSNELGTYQNWDIKNIYNKILLDYYPNETTIKSQFLNQYLFNGKKHVTIFELPILNSRIDLCKINGKSIAYEIKTDLDNFKRLGKQLDDYFKIFDEVFVICSTKKVKEVSELIPKETGIFSYRITKTKKYIFKLEKENQFNSKINNDVQLNTLNNSELFNIVKNDKDFSRENAINKILRTKSKDQINDIFKKNIKLRYSNQWSFLQQNYKNILEVDYQWFFKNTINPSIIYQRSF